MKIKALTFSNLYFLCVVFCFLVSLFVSVTSSYAIKADKVLATVNNEVIKFSDYQRFVKNIGNVKNKDVVDKDLLKRLIKEKIILHEAIRNGIEASDVEIDKGIEEFKKQNVLYQEDFEKALAQDGMNIDSFRKFMKDKIISSKIVSISVYSKVVKNEANAEAHAKEFKKAGYDAFTYKSTTKDKGILYRVLIGRFINMKEVAELANSIRVKEKIDVLIFCE